MMRVIFLLVMASAADAATTVTLRPSSTTLNSADAYVASANPAVNFGNAGALAVSGAGNVKGAFQSILRFDLASVKSTFDAAYGAGNWSLDSVTMELTSALPLNTSFNNNAAGTVHVDWLANDSWLENTVTWNDMPALILGGSESLGSLAYGGQNSGSTLYTLITSSGLNADLQAGGVAGLRLYAGDANVSMVVNSRNFGTIANRPALVFTASPEPALCILYGMGMCALILRRNRGR